MYVIVTLEMKDELVRKAINVIIKGRAGVLPGPKGNYCLFAVDAENPTQREGDGGARSDVLAIVGHGGANDLSGCSTWQQFRQRTSHVVDWTQINPASVYIVACSTSAEDGRQFLHGNIARNIKAAFPYATVWASSSGVEADRLTGDWQQVSG